MNGFENVALLLPLAQVTLPIDAPGITKAVNVEFELPDETKIAGTPPIVTVVVSNKLLPVMVTKVPGAPDNGVTEFIMGR